MEADISENVSYQLKTCGLKMLECFISVCEKIGVSYFAVGGTLLGAVRHGGFIPWDDDIDVGMFRSDYERFLENAQAFLPDYYFLQNAKSDTQFPYCFAKIRDSRTTFIETCTKNFYINHGAFIDIFPFDYYPESRVAGLVLELKKKILKTRIEKEFFYEKPLQRSFLGSIIEKFSIARYPEMSNAIKAQDKLFRSQRPSSLVTNYCGAWGKREIVRKAWLEETCILEFEGLMVSCPKFYHEYLSNVYGDYMQLPPVEERVGHHYTEYIDMNKPYTLYIKKQLKK